MNGLVDMFKLVAMVSMAPITIYLICIIGNDATNNNSSWTPKK